MASNVSAHAENDKFMNHQSSHVKGRPRGSAALNHRFHRDYRFAQETLDIAAKGGMLANNTNNETTFIAQVIIHDTACLAGEEKVN